MEEENLIKARQFQIPFTKSMELRSAIEEKNHTKLHDLVKPYFFNIIKSKSGKRKKKSMENTSERSKKKGKAKDKSIDDEKISSDNVDSNF